MITAERVRTIVSIYLLILGFWIVSRAATEYTKTTDGVFRRARAQTYSSAGAAGFGFVGGACDAMGGGWGPIVTSNLVASGLEPRVAVGSSIAAEFVITAVHSAVFAGVGDIRPDRVILGLLAVGIVVVISSLALLVR